jgi:hypothetical protein
MHDCHPVSAPPTALALSGRALHENRFLGFDYERERDERAICIAPGVASTPMLQSRPGVPGPLQRTPLVANPYSLSLPTDSRVGKAHQRSKKFTGNALVSVETRRLDAFGIARTPHAAVYPACDNPMGYYSTLARAHCR